MSNSFLTLPIAAIEKALGLRKQIEALQASLDAILGGVKESIIPKKADGRKGKRSPAARARMAAAQKARWAKKKGMATKAAPVEAAANGAKKKKRFVSPEARAKMAAAQRARWARKAA